MFTTGSKLGKRFEEYDPSLSCRLIAAIELALYHQPDNAQRRDTQGAPIYYDKPHIPLEPVVMTSQSKQAFLLDAECPWLGDSDCFRDPGLELSCLLWWECASFFHSRALLRYPYRRPDKCLDFPAPYPDLCILSTGRQALRRSSPASRLSGYLNE